jgi:hypothetical protein
MLKCIRMKQVELMHLDVDYTRLASVGDRAFFVRRHLNVEQSVRRLYCSSNYC